MHPLSHMHTHVHMLTGTRCPDGQTHGRMLGYARKHTHMLSLDTNLAGELATT